MDRNILAAKLIDVLTLVLRSFENHGFAPMMQAWNELSAFTNRQVRIIQTTGSLDGLMLGVDADGALLIKDNNGDQQRITDSRASLRLLS